MAKRITTVRFCKYCGKEFTTKTARHYCSASCSAIANSLKAKDTLCWRCEKATGGSDCPWANKLKPVEGWEAIPTILKMVVSKKSDSYKVLNCPLFKRG